MHQLDDEWAWQVWCHAGDALKSLHAALALVPMDWHPDVLSYESPKALREASHLLAGVLGAPPPIRP